ncbi:reverse transcriptase [Lasius niger]|uniref:Reverse transcriptase n=1 Tax=Lasius niger TaxID=67767 RepID=A0A0J7MT32_LASNI|nr:reverse transcriptase [Lasius niger]
MISKLFEILIQKRIQIYIERFNVIPNHQFGFRKSHATVDQIHRITDVIERAFEKKEVCSAVFLDVAQAFDKVWHEGLIFKLNRFLPKSYVKLLSSYLQDRVFRVRVENEYSSLKDINAGVPQGSILGPMLYLIFTSDLPVIENIKVATFADDTSLLATGRNIVESSTKLQEANDSITNWCKLWKIKLNETKSVHVNFTLKKIENQPNVTLNNIVVPLDNKAKYLGMTLDAKLHWKEHVKIKRKELDLKYSKLYWLIGRYSTLSIYNKTLIYNQVLKPTWSYGIQIFGCAKEVHRSRIQTFQNKVLRNIVNAPWYIRNSDLHRDLKVPLVKDEIAKYARKHRERLTQHVNTEASILIRNQPHIRRLRRLIPNDLI